jgi:hypothetical protein
MGDERREEIAIGDPMNLNAHSGGMTLAICA